MSSYYTITRYDVGRPSIRVDGRAWLVSSFMGRILASDIGKRVYLVGGVLQVESDEQRQARG